MATTMRASFTPAALRSAKTGVPRVNATRRALVVRATAGKAALHVGYIVDDAILAPAKRSVVAHPHLSLFDRRDRGV